MMRRTRMMTMFALVGSCCCAGCTTVITPPRSPADPVAVYITDYGRHSSILMPDPRDPHGSSASLVEFAYGDWNWFALRHTGALDALEAMLCSKYATIGRRQLKVPGFFDEPPDDERLARFVKANKVARLDVPRARVDELLGRLDALFEQHIDTVTYSPASDLWFVRYRGHYGLFHNCNHVTAAWLRELGCGVRGCSMFSKFTVKPAKSPAAAPRNASASPASAKLENRISYGPAGD